MGVGEHVKRWVTGRRIANALTRSTYQRDLLSTIHIEPIPLELNPYAYVANNPLRWTDPAGLLICELRCAWNNTVLVIGCNYELDLCLGDCEHKFSAPSPLWRLCTQACFNSFDECRKPYFDCLKTCEGCSRGMELQSRR